jgi:HEPN domain-containing protein/predicted nucleotidyltransferase
MGMPAVERTASSTLDTIVDIVADAFQPTRIILFGSRARGDAQEDSDYDIAVELEVTGDKAAVSSAISSAISGRHEYGVDILVRTPGEIERRMHDVGWIDYDIAREGIVVYAAGIGTVRQHMPLVLHVREGRPGAPESVVAWLRLAEDDLLNIENNMIAEVIPWSTICFHAQQAAEKYLKALLIQRNIRPPRTHELPDLLTAARAAGYPLDDIDDDCAFLNQFAVKVRYPENVVIPEQATGRRAADAVRRIVDAIRPEFVARPA